jgi:hypothetical protein
MDSSKLIPLGKLKRLLFIALLVGFACEDKEESESFSYTLLRTNEFHCSMGHQSGWTWLVIIGIENYTNYYVDSISVGVIVSFTDTTNNISKSDTLTMQATFFEPIPPKTNVTRSFNNYDCKMPPAEYQGSGYSYHELIEVTNTNIFQFEPHYHQFE